MPEVARSASVSRSAWLELREELELVNDGYEFLDQKRILLAAELLRQREGYRLERRDFDYRMRIAAERLVEAASALGLDALQVYPPAPLDEARLRVNVTPAVGLLMLEATLDAGAAQRPAAPPLPSPEASGCTQAFRELLSAAATLAARSANIKRLVYEYRRTERRVRALENVVIPEIRDDLKNMQEHLDLLEQEEVIRVRCSRVRR